MMILVEYYALGQGENQIVPGNKILTSDESYYIITTSLAEYAQVPNARMFLLFSFMCGSATQ